MARRISLLVLVAAIAAALSGCRKPGTQSTFLTHVGEQVKVTRDERGTTLESNGVVVLDSAKDITVIQDPWSPRGYDFAVQRTDGKWEIHNGDGTKVAEAGDVIGLVATKRGPAAVVRGDGGNTEVFVGSKKMTLPVDVIGCQVVVSSSGSVAAVGTSIEDSRNAKRTKGILIVKDGEIVDRASMFGEVALSPDGNSMAYVVADEEKGPGSQASGGGLCWVIRERVGTLTSQVGSGTYQGIYSLAYSPDGTKLVFAVVPKLKKDEASSIYRITVIRRDGSLIGGGYAQVGKPVFSHDGNSVAYPAVAERDKWCVVVDGKRLAGAYDMIRLLQFSPDGKDVVYAAQKGRRWFLVKNERILSRGAGYDGISQIVTLPDKIVFVGWRNRIGQRVELPW